MSLEEKLSALVDAVAANTDALQHLAAAHRSQQIVAATQASATTAANSAIGGAAAQQNAQTVVDPAAPPKRGPGRPRSAPASPAEQAAAKGATTSNTQGSAPAAANGSGGAASESLTYADLQEVVPKVAEKLGRSKAIALFAELGVTSGKDLQASSSGVWISFSMSLTAGK